MPALTANTVTLEEVLEVRGGPLTEEELWAVLAQSCEALQDVFQRGKARNRFFGSYSITPEMILLCHTGRVKFSLDQGYHFDRSYTAPETYANRATPSDTALEKICVYSLGMSLYHAAEFEVAVGKPISLNESLESVLLGMCEESAHARSGLSQVMQECQSHYSRRNYRDTVASLVESLLGDEIPDIEVHDSLYDMEAGNSTDISDYDISEENYPSRFSPVLATPRSLPSPPSLQTSSRGQSTSAQLVGSNHRRVLTPPITQRSASPGLNKSRPIPPTLEKYRSVLENARSKRSMAASLNGLDQLHTRESSPSWDQMTPHHPINRSEPRLDTPSVGYQKIPEASGYYPHPPAEGSQYERPTSHLSGDIQNRSGPSGTRPDIQGLNRFASMHSVASDSSSSASGPRSSMFSDGRSSSAVSITQGSYAPESYLTDGYESEFNLKSFGSSVSQNAFRAGRNIPSLSNNPLYLSVNDLHQPSAGLGSSLSGPLAADNRYHSLPNINRFNDIEKEKHDSEDTLKTFFGPEFVMITEDPEKSIVNITPVGQLRKDGQKKGFHSSHPRKIVTVVALNGQKLQLMAEVSMTTKDLFEQVTRFLGITEKIFFGLAKIEDDEVIFLDLDVKLSKYAPSKWKESKGEMVEFILYLRVKFYVEHTELLSLETTRHQFYLQLRKDILEGRLYCHEEAAFLLAGLALQAETGNYVDTLEGDYFLVEHYLNERIIKKLSVENTTLQLPEFHKNFAGLSEEQAELEFIQEAQKLPEYGIHFYKVQYSKKSDNSEKLYLGICVRGVTIYESRGHIKSPVHKHSWPMTKKLSFKKKKFLIEPMSNPDGVKLTFYTNHYKKAKYLLQMCTAFHRFQMKMRTRLASIKHEMSVDIDIENKHQAVDGPSKDKLYDRTPAPPIYKQNSLHTPLPRSVSTEYREISVDLPEEKYHAMPRSMSVEHNQEEPDTDEYHLPRSVSMQYSVDENHNKDYHGNQEPIGKHGKHDDLSPYVIDSTLNVPSKQENQQDDTKHLLSPKSPDGEIPNSRDILSSPDREIRVIKFTKEPGKGLGITVLGGENSKRLDRGIYVKSVTEGGAAARDGRLKAGDRILAVNGNSLEQVTHERAVTLLKTISSTVELVVSQSPHNVSALDLSNIPTAGSSNEEPQTLEVKPLITPPQQENRHLSRTRVESPCSSDTLSPTDSHPSTFNFPSEDEPVTMISKSISSLATPQSSSHSVPSKDRNSSSNYLTVSPPEKAGKTDSDEIPEPVTMATLESPNVTGSPSMGVRRDSKSPSTPYGKLSSREVLQSDISNDSQSSFTAGSVGSERSIEHGNSVDSDDLPDKSFTVELEKIDKSLGLSVTGGINTTVKLGGIYVKSLMLNGPADRDGQIRIGDRILAVDGISLVGVTHKQAVEIIRRAPQRCKIVLDRSVHVNVPASIKKNSSRTQAKDKPFVVELVKGIGGLGLSLVGGRDAGPEHGGLLRIKKMFPGQPAALSKKLALGDIVLEVNEKSLQNASHQDAINMIRHEPSVVRLLVKRDPYSIPEVLLSRAASNASDVDPVQLLNDIQNKLRSQTTSPVSSPPQEPQPNNIEQKLAEAAGEIRDLRDKREERVTYESDRTLQHQLSDPSALMAKQREHEPVTTSRSLPGKLSLKSRYFDNTPSEDKESVRKKEERDESEPDKPPYIDRKSSDSAVGESEQRRPDRRAADKISSESDLPSLLQQIRSEDSLNRIMSPQAPLAEYEESDLDIDEGIMINVDDGVAVKIDDDEHPTDSQDDVDDGSGGVNAITKAPGTSYPVRSEHDISLDVNDDESDDDTADNEDDSDDDSMNKVLATTVTPPKETSDTSDIDDDNAEDIDAVLELLSGSRTQHKPEELNQDNQEHSSSDDDDSEVNLNINEDLNESDNYLEPIQKNSTEPQMEERNDRPLYMVNNQPGPTWSEESLSEKLESLEETIVESTPDLTKISAQEEASLTPKEQLITVELEKGSGGLGFTLAGGADTMGGCFVRDVIGDPAKADGRLQKGDQILQVDDTDIRSMKHMEAVNVLRATKKFVKLVVVRRPTMVVKDGTSGHLETVNLTRTSRGRIGLLLKEDDQGVILVDDVVPGEPAAVEGNLKHGDVIVEIGGRKVEGIGFLAARQYLDAARPVVQLLVKRTNRAAVSKYTMGGSLEQGYSFSEDLPEENVDSGAESTDEEQDVEDVEEPKDDVFNVKLEKGPRGFGFSLVAAPSTEPNVQGIFIKTISAGSVAEKDGRLKVGDQLLKVNDEDVYGLSHARVIGMLRKVTTTVSLEIRRPGGAVTQTSSKEHKDNIKISDSKNSSPLSNSLDLDITLEDKEEDMTSMSRRY
ncbi:tyrosine-protein phosphatase non-receptor type 13-like isoform X2 [Actinia tenebrosa]|uniref:Tyrosine-protein phosphatase non-receptor type 13-like isoform X2 n=1 Tax=Actinia tenebrosa TaxID=6105 RepID=A0A6P8ILG9_ACTTE|nr:tyrosine-protein phosphatase non-receptor type 13-like isoform X2 [Actinia tenebrosa]